MRKCVLPRQIADGWITFLGKMMPGEFEAMQVNGTL